MTSRVVKTELKSFQSLDFVLERIKRKLMESLGINVIRKVPWCNIDAKLVDNNSVADPVYVGQNTLL